MSADMVDGTSVRDLVRRLHEERACANIWKLNAEREHDKRQAAELRCEAAWRRVARVERIARQAHVWQRVAWVMGGGVLGMAVGLLVGRLLGGAL
jgi:hypothetical protein